jgi:hypothetical protein
MSSVAEGAIFLKGGISGKEFFSKRPRHIEAFHGKRRQIVSEARLTLS